MPGEGVQRAGRRYRNKLYRDDDCWRKECCLMELKKVICNIDRRMVLVKYAKKNL